MRVIDEQRGHTLAMEVEEAKIALAEQRQASIPLEWVAPGLTAAIGRPDLVGHTGNWPSASRPASRTASRRRGCPPATSTPYS